MVIEPKIGPIGEWGLEIQKNALNVESSAFRKMAVIFININ